MSVKQLKHLLGELADEVQPASLHEPATAQSRRASMRRSVVAGVAIVAALSAGTAGAVEFMNGDSNTAEPSFDTSDMSELDGTFYGMWGGEGNLGSPPRLLTWHPGDDTGAALVSEWHANYSGALETVTASPDGQLIAYQVDGASDRVPQVIIENFGSVMARMPVDGADARNTCSAPAWSPDGSRVYFDRGGGQYGYVSTDDFPDNPRVTDVDVRGCHLQVATDADGNDVLYSIVEDGGETELIATTVDGKETVTPIGDVLRDAGSPLAALTAVSPDGGFACVSPEADFPSDIQSIRVTVCSTIINTQTGAVVDIPIDRGEDGVQQWGGSPTTFIGLDRLLVRNWVDNTVQLYDYRGLLLDETPILDIGDCDIVDTNGDPVTDCNPSLGGEPQLLHYVPDGNG